MKRTFSEAAIYCAAVALCLLIWLVGTIAVVRQRRRKEYYPPVRKLLR